MNFLSYFTACHFFHWSKWSSMSYFNVHLASGRITHTKIKAYSCWNWGVLPSVSLSSVAVCSFHLSIFSSGCAQGTAHLRSCHGWQSTPGWNLLGARHLHLKPPFLQRLFWEAHIFGCTTCQFIFNSPAAFVRALLALATLLNMSRCCL